MNLPAEAELSEALLATREEFASWVRHNAAILPRLNLGDYEVRPCLSVRGFMLRLPVTNWQLWFPTSEGATRYADRLKEIFQAECRLFTLDAEVVP